MSAHTPGPWVVDPYTGIAKEIRINDGEILLDYDDVDHAAQEANARLIAAAPDLLEALEKILECEEGRAADLRHRKAWLPLKFSDERMTEARAAMAKATGEGT